MPLPLPNLDTRRWIDLVAEGRALIPRHAPDWTDHNVSDPGITLIELFAAQVEANIYRTNRVPDRHRRKFLQLIGYPLRPPQPARLTLSFVLKPGKDPLLLPAGVTLAASPGGKALLFRTLAELRVIDTAITAVQSFDGTTFTDLTDARRDGLVLHPWGVDPRPVESPDPEAQPAFYLGLDRSLPPGEPASFWFRFAGPRSDRTARERIMEEVAAVREARRPIQSPPARPPGVITDQWHPPARAGASPTPRESDPPPHHSIRTEWDYFDGTQWQALAPHQGQVVDDTRGFTLDGAVVFRLSGTMGSLIAVGAIATKHLYLRCRLVAGPLDYVPVLAEVSVNAVEAEQAKVARGAFAIRPGVTPPAGAEPVVGKTGYLGFKLDADGAITALSFDATDEGPEARVLAYKAATPTDFGSLAVTLVLVGYGTDLPDARFNLPEAPVARGMARLWTCDGQSTQEWRLRPDLDASTRTDADFVLDATTGEGGAGDGQRGRMLPVDAAALAAYEVTEGAVGNIAAGAKWRLAGADDELNQALGINPQTVEEALSAVANRSPGSGGADRETPNHAAGRAVEALWAHERLLELCPPGQGATLDGLERDRVLALAAPVRATTLLDYERLALDVPGAPVARARAWAGLDPNYPCLKASGTVAVIVVPWLPRRCPQPSQGLIAAVRGFLNRRRIVGTRLVVVGPHYLKVSVRATVAVQPGSRRDRVREAVAAALDGFLDPLHGGPEGRGWPFGRDVYRAEILEAIDRAPGVDHVEALELIPDSGTAQCGNLCVGPFWLVTPGKHTIQLLGGGDHARTKY
jgi:hypothetical protein